MNRKNTRFNPTTNGDLHIGHIYLALVNEYEAHRSGGKFVLRLEDDQENIIWIMKQKQRSIPAICAQMIEDLEWINIKIDEIVYQSDIAESARALIHQLDPSQLLSGLKDMFTYRNAEVVGNQISYYPYAPHLTAMRVMMDAMSEIKLLIRGEDLMTEECLYALFCEQYRLRLPEMHYLPRLRLLDGSEIAEISKTDGNYRIAALREAGMSPAELIDRLRVSCLKDPHGEWIIDNVRSNPTWIW